MGSVKPGLELLIFCSSHLKEENWTGKEFPDNVFTRL